MLRMSSGRLRDRLRLAILCSHVADSPRRGGYGRHDRARGWRGRAAFNTALALLGVPLPVNLYERFSHARGESKLQMFMDAVGRDPERARTTPLVDLVLSPEDAGLGRPYPDLALTALLRLQVDDVRQLAVVGDIANDLVAGTRAGASIVAGVLTGAHGHDELEPAPAPPTHLIDSIAQFPALIRAAG